MNEHFHNMEKANRIEPRRPCSNEGECGAPLWVRQLFPTDSPPRGGVNGQGRVRVTRLIVTILRFLIFWNSQNELNRRSNLLQFSGFSLHIN